MMHAGNARESSPLANDLWVFANRFYAGDGIASACLALQDRLEVNVNVLLLGLFAYVQRGVCLSGEELSEADGRVDTWDREMVRPLRRLRTRLKSGPSPAPSASTAELRDKIKAIELEAERIELATLADWLDDREAVAPEPSKSSGASAVLSTVARHFSIGGEAALGDPDVQAALEKLALAADIARRETALSSGSPVERM
jgi:uncharacterized protein (TIGR02444 family)